MSEEEILKECTELAENEHHELGDCWDEEYSSSAIFGLIMLYKQTKKELNNLKEIEKTHQEENGKLRVELEQEKEKNNNLIKQLQEQNTEIQDISRQLRQEKEKTPESVRKQFETYQNRICELEEKNKELEEKLKIATAMLTKGTYPEQNEGDNDFDKKFIAVDKIKQKIEEIINSSARYNVLCKINENEETRRTRYAVAVLKELLEEK